ncbi:MAG: ABC transporter ATP-binding protein [Deltaproteobacteria bacterium]|uniref:ABC transporter ATP-binding protein n=1 Tax=Candidatus Zymogenus saltonus TaxID=2844893 RepID=A0A9D8PNN7_9DELT|nr:ABC transporter ATP-binding protein [Candidatus Zymogenus saltonus]
MSFIVYRGIEKAFDEKVIYRGLDLSINRGETITIIGGSGSGKSVLLKMMIGLIMPDRGEIIVDKTNIVELSKEELVKVRSRIGMLFQGGALFDSINVGENVAYGLKMHTEMSDKKIEKKVSRCLEMVGLSGIEGMMPVDLSGGMKKRVALARAIAYDPEIILYDEPTTGLDPTNANRINNLIIEMQKLLKVTSVVVTHDMNSAFSVSDRMAMLYRGKIEVVGTTNEIKKSKEPLVNDFIRGNIGEL